MTRNHDDSTAIFARDGNVIRRLRAHTQNNGRVQLADETGAFIAPWEVELLHWPPAIEAVLRDSGYLLVRIPDAELWCNCAD